MKPREKKIIYYRNNIYGNHGEYWLRDMTGIRNLFEGYGSAVGYDVYTDNGALLNMQPDSEELAGVLIGFEI